MSALNEHAGDGTSIPLPTVHLTELESPHVLLAMSDCEIEELKRKQEREVALKCANRVAQRYQGKPCMGTAIHSCVPQEGTPFENMFFDKLYMEKCHEAFTSSELKKLSACACSAYFMYQVDFFKKHYLLYDGATEGIRNGCLENEMKCDFHSRFDNPSQLSNGWSDLPIERVHPPVPNYFNNNDGYAIPKINMLCNLSCCETRFRLLCR